MWQVDSELPREGWYWDPDEYEYNMALKERWARELLVLDPDSQLYRIRYWDGRQWTDQRLNGQGSQTYHLSGSTLPHSASPSFRYSVVSPKTQRTMLVWWGVAMVAGVFVWLMWSWLG